LKFTHQIRKIIQSNFEMPITKRLKKAQEQQKQAEETSSSSSSENDSMDEGENSDEEIDENEEVMIDFEARSIEESDLESVKLLVQQKLGNFGLNVHETAKIVVQQGNIGNVIFQDPGNENEESENTDSAANSNEDSTIFGVLSLIDLNSPRCKNYSSAFKTFILKESQRADKKTSKNLYEKIAEIFREKRVVYCVNERFVNIPPAISVPMFESLLTDLETAKANKNENDFESDYWLFLSKHFETDLCGETNGSASNSDSDLIYSNAEEQVFEEFSELKFEISCGKSTPKGSNKDAQMNSVTNCLFLPVNKIKDCIEKIKSLL